MNTETTINGLDPTVVTKTRQEAARGERNRIAMLRAMRIPGVEHIIDEAIERGYDPNEVALECCRAIKEKAECDANIARLKGDCIAASQVPAGDAPFRFKASGEEVETEANKAIVAGFRRKKEAPPHRY